MMTMKCLAFFFTFIIFNTVDGEESSIRASVSSDGAQTLQRRYSEAILASDYSRSMDNLLKKNFVDWLLNRREKKSENMSDANKREADFQLPDLSMKETSTQDEPEGNRSVVAWLLRNKHKESSYSDARAVLGQELLDLLMRTTELCKMRLP
ncbi:glucagon-1-like [Bombina bombina]|uniref:glucagon-1-like n=1 Tax=Bombina bombina TaxID=8345 RepID=UPI00235A69C2|nr:glucagon-1-like [Bombina bombina]